MSVANVEKPALSDEEIARRAAAFAGYQPLWLTRAPTFVEKARLFPGAVFVVGADTAARVVDGAVDDQAAGHTPETEPAREVVTAACTGTVAPEPGVGEGTFLDFAHLKSQLPMARVLDHLGLSERLRGAGPQRRCACPIHRGDGRGRTFSVNLSEDVFCCFDSRCGKRGDAIDLWSAVRQMSLREAALDLVRTFALEPAPVKATEKRHG